MPVEYNTQNPDSKWIKAPKTGESYDFSPHGFIIKAERVTGGKFNYIKRTKEDGKTIEEDLGYHDEYTFEDGKVLQNNSWCLLYALRDTNVQEGCKIKINHPVKGEWQVEVLERQDG